MSNLHERAAPLISLLYTTPGDRVAAKRFVGALCAAISEQVAAVGILRPPGAPPSSVIAFGPDASRTGAAAELGVLTESGGGIEALPVGAVFQIPGFGRTTLFRTLIEPFGVRPGPGLGLVLQRDAARVTLALLLLPNGASWAPSDDDRALLELLAPHMEQSLRLHLRLNESSVGTGALVAAFDQLALGVILLDANNCVSFANKSAAEILKIDPGMTAENGRSGAFRPVRGLLGGTVSGSQIYRHPVDDRPLQVLSTTLSWPPHLVRAQERFTRAIFIGDPKSGTGDPVGILADLYGLTPGEARLAVLLAGDRSLEQAAGQLGVTVNTARGQLKSVFSKTGTNRQASLVRLLLTAPSQLRRSDPDELQRQLRRSSR